MAYLTGVLRKPLIIVLPLAAVGVAALLWYWIVKPRRQAELVLAGIRRVEVGKTRLEELKAILPQSSFLGAEWVCQSNQCIYTFMTSNDLLRRLHLAPGTLLLTDVYVTDGVASDIVIHFDIGAYGEFATIRFVQGQAQIPPENSFFHCEKGREEKCIKRYNDTDGTPLRVYMALAPSVPVTERNRLLSLDTACLSRIHGCRNAREALPISETK